MLLSIVIPVFNEAQSIPLLLPRLRDTLCAVDWEVIFVNDGSTDETTNILAKAALEDGRIKMISFSRNFGHQAAITAGLDFAEGDAVAVMDADLQDPPELLFQLLDYFYVGYDIVSPQRTCRQQETWFKKITASLYYRLLARLSSQSLTPDVGDFRLLSRRAVVAIRSLREQHRYMRGMIAWLGLREAVVPFERQARVAGQTNYSLSKMLRLAWTGISSFSALPLYLSVALGGFLFTAGVLSLIAMLALAFFTRSAISPWTEVLSLECVLSGMILLALGAIGDYVARTFDESRNRPLYVATEAYNLPIPLETPKRAVILAESMLLAPEMQLGTDITSSNSENLSPVYVLRRRKRQ